MALIFIDGFDHYATADMLSMWSSTSSSPIINASGGRFSGGSLVSPSNSSNGSQVQKSIADIQTLIMGAAVKVSSYPTAIRTLIQLRDSGTDQFSIKLTLDGTITVYRGATLLATSSTIIGLNIWKYIELKVKIDNSVGTYEVRVNGVNILSGTGADTQSTANATVNSVALGFEGSSGVNVTYSFDDFYVLDTTGSAPNNDFLGDVRVDTVFPTAEGNYSQFTPSTGTNNAALVDETAPNGDTDYNSDSTATNKDSYAMGNLTALTTQTIYGVQVSMYMKKTDAGARSAKVGVRSNVTDSVSAAQALSASYTYYHNIHELDPDTAAAWTEAGVNAMETLVETV